MGYDRSQNGGERPKRDDWNDRTRRAANLRERIGAAAQMLTATEQARASFNGIQRQWQLMMEAFQGMRAEHSQLLTDLRGLRGLRAELRASVRAYAMLLRRQGVQPHEMTTAVEDVVDEALEEAPPGVPDTLHADILKWAHDAYDDPNY
jgi:hypothetical protein